MGMYIIFGVLIVGLIGMSVFQNKQRKKQAVQEQEKKSRICAGTKVITIGGIIGNVVSVDHNERSFVLESNGSLIKFDMRSIYQMQLPAEVEAQIAAEAQLAASQAQKKVKVEEPAQENVEEKAE